MFKIFLIIHNDVIENDMFANFTLLQWIAKQLKALQSMSIDS